MSNETPSLSDRDHRMYLEDMLEFCEAVLTYTAGYSREALGADAMRCGLMRRCAIYR